MPDALALDGELADFLRRRASLTLAAANDGGVPELALGLAGLIDDDGRRLRVVFDRRHAAPLLALVAAGCHRVALVASRPTSLRTVQVKGLDARIEPLPVADRAEVTLAVAAIREELGRINFGGAYAATLFDHDPAELISVGFVPTAVFDQTPGPRAGTALAGMP